MLTDTAADKYRQHVENLGVEVVRFSAERPSYLLLFLPLFGFQPQRLGTLSVRGLRNIEVIELFRQRSRGLVGGGRLDYFVDYQVPGAPEDEDLPTLTTSGLEWQGEKLAEVLNGDEQLLNLLYPRLQELGIDDIEVSARTSGWAGIRVRKRRDYWFGLSQALLPDQQDLEAYSIIAGHIRSLG